MLGSSDAAAVAAAPTASFEMLHSSLREVWERQLSSNARSSSTLREGMQRCQVRCWRERGGVCEAGEMRALGSRGCRRPSRGVQSHIWEGRNRVPEGTAVSAGAPWELAVCVPQTSTLCMA